MLKANVLTLIAVVLTSSLAFATVTPKCSYEFQTGRIASVSLDGSEAYKTTLYFECHSSAGGSLLQQLVAVTGSASGVESRAFLVEAEYFTDIVLGNGGYLNPSFSVTSHLNGTTRKVEANRCELRGQSRDCESAGGGGYGG